MPSPVGHALGAIAAGWAVAPPPRERAALVTQTMILAAIGVAPDLDLVLGYHRGDTHSLGAALLVAAVAAWRRWPIASTRTRVFVAALAAYATHPILDMLADDSSLPFGVMALWPFSSTYYLSPWPVFLSVYRHWWEASFYRQNTLALARELALLGPLAALAWWVRRERALPLKIAPSEIEDRLKIERFGD